jgi:copper chaperone
MKKTYRVNDMHCSMCVIRLESIEDEIPGIKRVEASYHKQQMRVEFDEAQVSDEQIIAAAAAKGYTAVAI